MTPTEQTPRDVIGQAQSPAPLWKLWLVCWFGMFLPLGLIDPVFIAGWIASSPFTLGIPMAIMLVLTDNRPVADYQTTSGGAGARPSATRGR